MCWEDEIYGFVRIIKTCKEVFKNVYGRQTVVPPATTFIHSTVMALLCCNLIKLDINFDEKPTSLCKLSVNKKSLPNIYNDEN